MVQKASSNCLLHIAKIIGSVERGGAEVVVKNVLLKICDALDVGFTPYGI